MDGSRYTGPGFGTVAAEYDRWRPTYPPDLLTALRTRLDSAGFARGPVLEVGAGTGQATVDLATLGLEITALEPAPELAAILRHRCAGLPEVTVVQSRFEDYRGGPFPVLCSAQSWHWIDPEVRWPAAARTLTPGGVLALFWTFDQLADRRLQEAVTAAHSWLTPQLSWDPQPLDEDDLKGRWPGDDLAELPQFDDVTARLFRWQRPLTRPEYLAYLGTHSPYLKLTTSARERLFAALTDILPDEVTLAEDTVLYLARRTSVG